MGNFNLLGKIEKNQKYKDLGKLFIKAGADHYNEGGLKFTDSLKEKEDKIFIDIYVDYSKPYITICVKKFNCFSTKINYYINDMLENPKFKARNIFKNIEEKVNEIKEKHIKELMRKRSVFELTYNNNLLTIKYSKGKNNLEELINYLKENKIKYNRIFSERPTLNDVFLELTGKGLRD